MHVFFSQMPQLYRQERTFANPLPPSRGRPSSKDASRGWSDRGGRLARNGRVRDSLGRGHVPDLSVIAPSPCAIDARRVFLSCAADKGGLPRVTVLRRRTPRVGRPEASV
jgi:hypothetical protein